MSGFLGMDPEQARDHAERMRTEGERVTNLSERLTTAVNSAQWVGHDADSFRDQWKTLSQQRIGTMIEQIQTLAGELEGQADQQDVTSARDGSESGPAEKESTLPPGQSESNGAGYRHTDNPWIPNWLENPVEDLFSSGASVASDLIGNVFDKGMDFGIGLGEKLGINTEGLKQFQRDAEHFGGMLEDWATGERVPAVSELIAGGLLTTGSLGVGLYEAVTGKDTPFLDDRGGGIVHGVDTSATPGASPDTLQDLILRNNELRLDNPDSNPLSAGQIGIQEIQSAHGGEPSYIVQIPPTEGAGFLDLNSYGAQGNSKDWASNLRLVAGQHPAAMDDVRAALEAAGVPAGANVMLVGHSQGGIIGSHLAADPTFNSSSGEAGTYNVTHAFSVGSPVQTVLPSQSSTEVVNVAHTPVTFGFPTSHGDPIPALDLQGKLVDGSRLGAPNVHDVSLPGTEAPVEGMQWLWDNHDSVGKNDDPSGGYAGSLARHTSSDPVLSALQNDLQGVYLGDGTYVSRDTVVTVGREHRVP